MHHDWFHSDPEWFHRDPDVHVSVATAADREAWREFVDRRGDPAGYHAWGWRDVFARAFGHETVYLIARRGGEVEGVLPLVYIRSLLFGNSLTSLPFVNYGGVMASTRAAALALALAAREEAARRRCGHVELRHADAQFHGLPCKHHKVAMRLDLAGDPMAAFDRKLRNQIRKAQRSPFAVEHGGAELVRDFYTVFARNMRDLGTPVYSRRLFEEVLRVFPDRAGVHVVRLGGKPVAAGLTYRSGPVLQLPWASSIRDFNQLCPNTLLYWSVIEHACRTGASTFDMGRCTPGEGTFRFKAQWGARAVPLSWEYLLVSAANMPDVSPANPKFRMAIALWQRLPLALTRKVGPMIVRAIP